MIGIIRAPESPWLLCRQGRDEDARIALRRLTSQDCGVPFDVDKQLAMIKGNVLILPGAFCEQDDD